MATVRGAIVIDRPVDLVFDVVADERNEPAYNAELLRSEKLTTGPIGVGTQFRALHRSGGRPAEMLIEITEFDPPRRVASRTALTWSDIEGEVRFEPVGRRTRMRWEWTVRPKGSARYLGPLIGVAGRRSERACWRGLKRYLEWGAPPRT